MADTVGPKQFQGATEGGSGAPVGGRYSRQIEANGAMQGANAQGARVISGFGEGAQALAKGMGDVGEAFERRKINEVEAANRLWMVNARSASELLAQKMLIDASNKAQPGEAISGEIGKNWQTHVQEQIKGIQDPVLKAHYAEALTEIGHGALSKAQAWDDGQHADFALYNFNEALQNKAKLYLATPYSEVDEKLARDLGEINSTLGGLSVDPSTKLKMRTAMMQQLTDAANFAKLTADPMKYKTEQALAHPPEMRMGDASLPRGIRNNNPGNLTGDHSWQGRSGADDKGFVKFATPEAGLRAMAVNLKNQQDMHGLSTVQAIVAKYAPPTENNTPAYVATVANALGVKPDEKIDLSKPGTLATMMHAMIQHENGVQPYSKDSIFWAAATAAQEDLAGPPPPSTAAAGSGISVTQQGDDSEHHVTTGSLAFSMGTYEQQKDWMAQSRVAVDGLFAAQERAARMQREQQAAAQLQTKNDLLTKFYSDELSMQDVMNSNLPAFGEGSKKEFVELIRKGPNAEGNERLHQELYIKTLNGDLNDPSDLVPYLTQEGGINTSQAQNIAAILKDTREQAVKTFVGGAKSQITGSSDLVPDPDGDAQFSAFLFDMQRRIDEAQKQGLKPRDILDPASKNYIGDKLIATYRRTPEQKIDAMVNQIRAQQAEQGDENARRPNESVSDWINRTKGKK